MEYYVVSRDIAEQLKAAGYPQNTQFYWTTNVDFYLISAAARLMSNSSKNFTAAPLSDEMLESLPTSILKLWKHSLGFSAGYAGTKDVSSDTPANALAQLWIWCKTNGYLEN